VTRLAQITAAVAAAALLAAGSSVGARQFRIAFVTDLTPSTSRHDFRGIAYRGFLRAAKDFGVQGRVVQSNPTQGPGETIASLARERYDLIVVGEVQSLRDVDTLSAIGRRFPQSRFVMTDLPVQKAPKNVQGSLWQVEEPAYLAGYLAALMEKRRLGNDVVGSVGGFPILPVDTFIAGYEGGAKKANPGIRTLRGYAESFFDTAKCKSVALSQIAKGAGVVFDVAGVCGLGVLQAVRERGVWGIGVDVDQSYLGPQILTSVVKRYDVEVYATVEALVQGRLRTGGNSVWSLRNGGVGLGKISPKVPRALVAEVAKIRAEIAAGTIKVPTTLR
jgi:basic membrane protein A and related proteins